jgi:hypothetical protein
MDYLQVIQVFLISCFFSFGVQTLAYFYYKSIKHPLVRAHKSVVHYWSGIIGDGVLVPGVNVFCLMTIYHLGQGLRDFGIWPYALAGGVFITFIFHYYQQRWNLTNWTMPEVGRWNLLGIYHALFMFCESTFLCYSLGAVITHGSNSGFTLIIGSPLKYSLIVLGIFLITFLYDYRKAFGINVLRRESR